MLGQRLRRWPNVNPALVQTALFAAWATFSGGRAHTPHTITPRNDTPVNPSPPIAARKDTISDSKPLKTIKNLSRAAKWYTAQGISTDVSRQKHGTSQQQCWMNSGPLSETLVL